MSAKWRAHCRRRSLEARQELLVAGHVSNSPKNHYDAGELRLRPQCGTSARGSTPAAGERCTPGQPLLTREHVIGHEAMSLTVDELNTLFGDGARQGKSSSPSGTR